jgi:hypothetical protein
MLAKYFLTLPSALATDQRKIFCTRDISGCDAAVKQRKLSKHQKNVIRKII